MSRLSKSLFTQPCAHGDTSLMLEQALEIRRAQAELESQITHREGSRLNHFQDLSHPVIQKCGRQSVRRSLVIRHSAGENCGISVVPSCKTDTRIQGAHRGLLQGSVRSL